MPPRHDPADAALAALRYQTRAKFAAAPAGSVRPPRCIGAKEAGRGTPKGPRQTRLHLLSARFDADFIPSVADGLLLGAARSITTARIGHSATGEGRKTRRG